ncbi:Methyltransferase type 11 [Niveomyces insectorum RCEF 264]|uniref:Methyltransferase type 11 n=1 Tax=Niveomyces insectorum RCEF 264 TaxID=1081102 RepID=A0A167USU4_9HYPO|nr:Methyltransferase type 11 [Niveomyces insectorum RCEF 264]
MCADKVDKADKADKADEGKTPPGGSPLKGMSPSGSPRKTPPAAAGSPPGAAAAGAAANHPPGSVTSGSAIEAASQPGEEDEFDYVDGYDTATDSLGSTSATSSIYAHTIENGRRYHHFKNSRYPLPDDDMEQSREDMKHAMMLELTDGLLFYAPIGDHPQEILDVGTGTGIWAIEVGDKFPSAHVRGIDMTPIQPVWIPPNVDFLVDDCNSEWLAQNVDFAHFRFMTPILPDIAGVLRNCYRSLRPGGWVELQELHAEILCDDDTMPADDPLKYMYELAGQAFAKFGMNVLQARHMEPVLRDAGFVNIQCVAKKVPIGVWARDKTLRLIGLYQKLAVADILGAVAGRPFAALGIQPVEREVIAAHARRALEDARVHRYFSYYFWFAQKPVDAGDTGPEEGGAPAAPDAPS